MSQRQAPFTLESFEASTRAEYGWSDQPPTLADLAGMVSDLADEIELGDTSRSKHLAMKIQEATFIVEPIVSKKKHRRRNWDQVEVIRYRDGRFTAKVLHADGGTSIRAHGLRRTVEADQLCSDLEITFRLCRDLLEGISDPMRPTKLRTLSERFEAKDPRPGGGQDEVEVGAIPPSGLQAGGSEVPADPSEDRKCEASADFTSAIWRGVKYEFAKGLQAEAIKVLWVEWEKGGLSLSEQTIGDKIGSDADKFRLDHVFRSRKPNGQGWCTHKAWGTMIVPAGKGKYKLNDPSTP